MCFILPVRYLTQLVLLFGLFVVVEIDSFIYIIYKFNWNFFYVYTQFEKKNKRNELGIEL